MFKAAGVAILESEFLQLETLAYVQQLTLEKGLCNLFQGICGFNFDMKGVHRVKFSGRTDCAEAT